MAFPHLRRWFAATAVALGALGAPVAQAASFSDIVFFGDSLSDTGNLNIATGGAQPGAGAYFGGRFSNGPLWTEVFAGLLGQPGDAVASFAGGNNYAFAGARTGTSDSPPGLLAQAVGLWGASHAAADPNALYVVVGGGNDVRDARTAFSGTTAADAAGRQGLIAQAGTNLGQTLGYLASKGAKNVLIANLPDLQYTPEAVLLNVAAASGDASARFNALFPTLLATGAGFGLNMSFVDFAGIAAAVRADATTNGGAVYGITDISHPCVGFAFSAGNLCTVSAFSDALHPSAAVHELFGQAAAAAVTAVPEPATVLLLVAGLAAVGAGARRRAAA